MAATGKRKKSKGRVYDIAKAERNAKTYAESLYKDTNFHLAALTQSEFRLASEAIIQSIVSAYGEGYVSGINDKGKADESE